MSTGQWLATVGGGGTTPFWQILARNSLSGTADTIQVTSGWVEVAGASSTKNFTLDTANSELDVKFLGNGASGHGGNANYDLGSDVVSETTWTLQFTINYSAQVGNQGVGYVGLFDSTADSNTAQNGLYVVFMNNDNNVNAEGIDGQAPNQQFGQNVSGTLNTGTDYYITLKRTSATVATLDIKTGSHSGSSLTNYPATTSNGITTGVENLRYIKTMDRAGYSTGTSNGDIAVIKDMKIWVDSNDTTTDPTKEFDFSSTGNLIVKPYLMVLANLFDDGLITSNVTFNNDTGSNYAYRYAVNGTEHTGINQSSLLSSLDIGGYASNGFLNFMVTNKSDKEKLVIGHTIREASPPERKEAAGKWVNTSSQITQVGVDNSAGGSYDTGSEVVVLGFDPEDTSGTNAWEELASVDLSGGAATTLSSGTFTPKKYLMIQAFCDAASGATDRKLILGTGGTIDTGSNYDRRRADNGTDSGTSSSSRIMSLSDSAAAGEFFVEGFLTNVSSKEKMFIGQGVTQGTAGAGNAPSRTEAVGKWTNTSGQINIINIVADANMGTKTRLTVWGFD